MTLKVAIVTFGNNFVSFTVLLYIYFISFKKGCMKILVTGGAGFIGSHLVDGYLKAGHEVAVVDDLSGGTRAFLSEDAHLFALDICSDEIETVFRDFRPDVVNHHAAQSSVAVSVHDPKIDAKVNICGMLNILRHAVNFDVSKLIFASSGGTVYGEANQFPIPETARLNSLSPYGISKTAGEIYLRYYADRYDLRYTILRYSNVYGPRQSADGEAGVVAIFCQKLLMGDRPVIFAAREAGDSGCTRDYVHVGDVVKANLLALQQGDGEILNIGTSVETSTRALFNLLALEAGFEDGPEFGPPRPGDLLRNVLDVSKAETCMDWRPEVSLEDGVNRTFAFYANRERQKHRAGRLINCC